MLWEALAGSHPFWGVPLPEVAAAIAGRPAAALRAPRRPPAQAARRDRPRAHDRPRAGDRPPRSSPTELREAFVAAATAARRGSVRGSPLGRKRPRRAPRVAAPPVALAERRAPGGASPRPRRQSAARCCRSGRRLSSRCSRSRPGSRRFAPRDSGSPLALAAPVFPLGNVAQAAAVVYGVLALAWLAVSWRDARAGLLFALGRCSRRSVSCALLPARRAAGARRRGVARCTRASACSRPRPSPGSRAPAAAHRCRRRRPGRSAESERPTDVVQALAARAPRRPGARDDRARARPRRRAPPARRARAVGIRPRRAAARARPARAPSSRVRRRRRAWLLCGALSPDRISARDSASAGRRWFRSPHAGWWP